jgi:NAD(P)-dependent dehydrogenase (short-subunit alcohol dehydrogenase family)
VQYLITGASGGIGRALVSLLAPTHEVVAACRSSHLLVGPGVSPVELDLSADPASWRLPSFDRLDGLVHCAGVVRPGRVESQGVDDWTSQLVVNAVAPAVLTARLLPALRSAGGAVVFVNSGSGQRARAGMTSYGASKFALRALADGLREEEPSLRVTTVYPGRTDTRMQRVVRAYEDGPYVADDYLQASTVAGVIAQVLATPADAVVPEVSVRPHPA